MGGRSYSSPVSQQICSKGRRVKYGVYMTRSHFLPRQSIPYLPRRSDDREHGSVKRPTSQIRWLFFTADVNFGLHRLCSAVEVLRYYETRTTVVRDKNGPDCEVNGVRNKLSARLPADDFAPAPARPPPKRRHWRTTVLSRLPFVYSAITSRGHPQRLNTVHGRCTDILRIRPMRIISTGALACDRAADLCQWGRLSSVDTTTIHHVIYPIS
ncbi:hypothetical protein ACI65C_004264 [Semiaphis heraclei]